MRLEAATRFRLLGRRSYVHSTQIFAEFLKLAAELQRQGQPVGTVRLFKFIRETARDGHCVICEPDPEIARAAASTMSFTTVGGTELQLAFLDDGGEAERGGPDLAPCIASVDHTGDYAGRVLLKGSGAPHQLFVDLIEANKALHNATLVKSAGDKAPPYRFVYAENLPATDMDRDLELSFTARDVRNRGGHTFTLTEVRSAGAPSPAPIRICFSY